MQLPSVPKGCFGTPSNLGRTWATIDPRVPTIVITGEFGGGAHNPHLYRCPQPSAASKDAFCAPRLFWHESLQIAAILHNRVMKTHRKSLARGEGVGGEILSHVEMFSRAGQRSGRLRLLADVARWQRSRPRGLIYWGAGATFYPLSSHVKARPHGAAVVEGSLAFVTAWLERCIPF